MTSDQPDSTSPTLQRIFGIRRVALRITIGAAVVWVASPLVIGVLFLAQSGSWLWNLTVVPAAVCLVSGLIWGSSHGRESRFRSMRAAAEDLAVEQERAPDGSGS